jgi:hypothetical protein
MSKRIVTCVVVLTLIAIGWGRGVRSYAQEGDGPPAVGSPVSIIGLEGAEVAQITVTEVENPFEDIDPSAAPNRSYRYVLVHLVVENTGSRPFLAATNSVSLQDADGFLYLQTFLPRSEEQIAADPDFPNEEIAPGDTASGVIAFEVLESADLVRVVYQPAFDRLIFLADLTQEGAAPPADDEEATPATDDEDDTGDAGAADDTADTDDAGADTGTDVSDDADDPAGDDLDETASVDVSAGECDDVQAWLDDVTPQLDVLSETLDDVAAEDPIAPETLEDAAADLQEAADNLRDSDPPDLMEESADLLAEALDGYAAIYLDAAEAGEEISVEDFFTNLDTSEPDALLDEVGTVSDPILAACGIDA